MAIVDKGVFIKTQRVKNGDDYFVDALNSIEQTRLPFQGSPTFPGGYPTNTANPEYPGYITFPQRSIEIKGHWRHANVTDLSPENYHKLYKVEGLEYENQYLSPSKEADDAQYLITDKRQHFIRDYNDPSSLKIIDFDRPRGQSRDPREVGLTYNDIFDDKATERLAYYTNEFKAIRPVFSGSTTLVVPESDPNYFVKRRILGMACDDEGNRAAYSGSLEIVEQFEVRKANNAKSEGATSNVTKSGDKNASGEAAQGKEAEFVPLSPLHPFTRINDMGGDNKFLVNKVHSAIFETYNRTHTPIADAEFRKGFRHIFFSRPECYVCCNTNGEVGLCEQAAYDEDFSSLYQRQPHIVKLLSPSYISTNNSTNADNWNYLLSNRVISMSTGEDSLSQKETVTKTEEGYTVLPGLHLESRTGSTITVSFRDTKNLEVYEFIRGWMAYIHKRARGIFAPPYNGYNYRNSFFDTGNKKKTLSVADMAMLHPYDRALEYCASIYDFVTNEADTKVIYWCKYYGIYPVQVSSPITNENNGPLTNENMKIDVTFRYQYKLPGVNKTLVEFNYNSGICDQFGRVRLTTNPTFSSPFMVKDASSGVSTDDIDNNQVVDTLGKLKSGGGDLQKALKYHVGAAGMFTGTPMILMTMMGTIDGASSVYPVLRFQPLNNNRADLSRTLNLGYELAVHVGDNEKVKYARFV